MDYPMVFVDLVRRWGRWWLLMLCGGVSAGLGRGIRRGAIERAERACKLIVGLMRYSFC